MHTAGEYLVHSIISYINFTKADEGKKIWDILQDKKIEKRLYYNKYSFLNIRSYKIFLDFSKNLWEGWILYRVTDNTAKNNIRKSTGFYAITLKKQEKFIITYRGSESYSHGRCL